MRCSKNQLRGFTLIELLVSMAVLSLLVVMLMGLVDSATKLWRENENRVESYREARAALNLIASDLGSMHASTNTNYFRFVAEGTNGDGSIAFLSALPLSAQDSTNLSDLCAVGYFLAKGRISDIGTNSSSESYNLYRYFLQSNDTFRALTNRPVTLWPATFDADTSNTEIVARNVRSFQVTAYTRSGNGTGWSAWTNTSSTPPDLLELRIEAVNNDARKRFDGDLKQDTPALTNQVRAWTTRVALPKPPELQ